MAEESSEATEEVEAPKKRSKKPLVFGLVGALALGSGGFFAAYSGLLGGGEAKDEAQAEKDKPVEPLPKIAFVPVEPLTINLGDDGARRHLRFRAELEVAPSHQDEVTALMPRILDVLNGYLRAVSLRELEERTALIRLRAQMLRRIQLVTGEGRVRDLLVMEFVLN